MATCDDNLGLTCDDGGEKEVGDLVDHEFPAADQIRYVMAPMVRGSDLAFRKLANMPLSWSPMVVSEGLLGALEKVNQKQDGEEEEEAVLKIERAYGLDVEPNEGCVVQIAGSDPEIVSKMAKYIEKRFKDNKGACAIDINFGCPQTNAERMCFGAFLLKKPELAEKLVAAVNEATSLPVFCKIRILETADETIQFSKTLERAGCKLLSIHARLTKAKGHGPTNVKLAKLVAESVKIPVLFNGGIATKLQADEFLNENPCFAGVMIASGVLENPYFMSGKPLPQNLEQAIQVAFSYLEFTMLHPEPDYRYFQVHLRWILRKQLKEKSRKWWSFLQRPYLVSAWQYMNLLRLIALDFQIQPPNLEKYSMPLLETTKDLRRGWVDDGGDPLEQGLGSLVV